MSWLQVNLVYRLCHKVRKVPAATCPHSCALGESYVRRRLSHYSSKFDCMFCRRFSSLETRAQKHNRLGQRQISTKLPEPKASITTTGSNYHNLLFCDLAIKRFVGQALWEPHVKRAMLYAMRKGVRQKWGALWLPLVYFLTVSYISVNFIPRLHGTFLVGNDTHGEQCIFRGVSSLELI